MQLHSAYFIPNQSSFRPSARATVSYMIVVVVVLVIVVVVVVGSDGCGSVDGKQHIMW